MHRMWVLAMLLIVPLAAAKERDVGFYNPVVATPTTMYVHLNDFQDAPINTQRPDDRYVVGDDLGLVQHSQGCVDVPNAGLVSAAHHTQYGFSSPGYVNYDIDVGGKPKYHNERGISFDVDLDASQPVRFFWYVETQSTSGSFDPNPNQVPVVVPQVVVRATLREGDDISVGAVAYNQGAIIAQGQSQTALLAGPLTDTPGVTYMQYNDRHMYEFAFELDIERDVIRKDESFNLRVDIYQQNGVCEDPATDEYLMADLVRTHSSPGHRPRFVWDVMNPLRIESLHPMFIGDDLVVHATVNSPWGNYDILGDDTDKGAKPMLAIAGPSVPVGLKLLAHTSQFVEHDHHTEAVALAWGWPYLEEKARPGVYRVEMEAANDQENARAFAVAEFQIGADGRPGSVTGCGYDGQSGCKNEPIIAKPGVDKGTPGLGLAWLAMALAFATRRRA